MQPQEQLKYRELAIFAGQVFNPNTPVNEKDLFSGRANQIRRVIDVIFQRGQHAIIFGERGVGKTSLANVLSSFIPLAGAKIQLLTTRINCDSMDDFTSVWKKLFDEIGLSMQKQAPSFKQEPGFNTINKTEICSSADFFPNAYVTPEDVRRALINVSRFFLPILIFDEFDRLRPDTRKLFADLIKSLSDHSLEATLILIGVGDSVDDLIGDHQSVSRALVQIKMPRMSYDEIKTIITNSLFRLGMTIQDTTLRKIYLLSKGLPHYAHLLGLHASRDALDSFSFMVHESNLIRAINKAVEDVQHSIKTAYFKAIKSARKDNLFSDVLLSCALANVNELGEFAAQDLREPMERIKGKVYDFNAYSQHLFEFSEDIRGRILIKSGRKRLYKYKFADPLMQPFVIMQGVLDNKISTQSFLPTQLEGGDTIQGELPLM